MVPIENDTILYTLKICQEDRSHIKCCYHNKIKRERDVRMRLRDLVASSGRMYVGGEHPIFYSRVTLYHRNGGTADFSSLKQ